jgi:hypothetical protein
MSDIFGDRTREEMQQEITKLRAERDEAWLNNATLRADLAAANARLAVSMEAHQITISGTVASLLHTITLTREAAGCRDGDNLPAFVGVMRRLIDAVEAMGYEWRWTKSIDENGEQVGAWHGENSPILMEPIEDKNDTISRLKRENIKLLLRIAEYEAREH